MTGRRKKSLHTEHGMKFSVPRRSLSTGSNAAVLSEGNSQVAFPVPLKASVESDSQLGASLLSLIGCLICFVQHLDSEIIVGFSNHRKKWESTTNLHPTSWWGAPGQSTGFSRPQQHLRPTATSAVLSGAAKHQPNTSSSVATEPSLLPPCAEAFFFFLFFFFPLHQTMRF